MAAAHRVQPNQRQPTDCSGTGAPRGGRFADGVNAYFVTNVTLFALLTIGAVWGISCFFEPAWYAWIAILPVIVICDAFLVEKLISRVTNAAVSGLLRRRDAVRLARKIDAYKRMHPSESIASAISSKTLESASGGG